jgi:uncharacterized protein (DUF488 family)
MAVATPEIYSIGHSNHTLDAFLARLAAHRIEVLVDTRTQPHSAYSPHFNQRELSAATVAQGMKYLFLGQELGGRPSGSEYYDADGRVLYYLRAESAEFLAGVARLERGLLDYRVALLCSEEDPHVCHRRLLVGRVLLERGVTLHHIRGDGRVETESPDAREKQTFFSFGKDTAWKSLRSVLPKKAPRSSSTDSANEESADWSTCD